MADPSRIGIYSENVDNSGTDRIPLATLGRVSGIVYGTTFPGGDDVLTCNLELDALAMHRALQIGRRIRASLCAQTIWGGVLDTPTPGQPWQLACTGRASMGAQFIVSPDFASNATIDTKIGEGLPWVRAASLPDPPFSASATPLSLMTVGDWMNAAALTVGEQWSVAADGTVTVVAPPTTPSYVLVATDRPARTAANYYSRVFALYTDSSTAAPAVVSANGSAANGVRQGQVDLTSLGPISAAQANAYVATLATRTGFRASYAAPFIVQPGRLLSYPGGVPVDLATVRAGSMVRPTGLDPSQFAEATTPGIGSTDFVIGTTSYDDDSGVLSLTPYEDATSTEDLQSIVSDLVKQAA